MSNLVPMCVAAPLPAAAIAVQMRDPLGFMWIYLLGATPVMLVFTINFFGLYQNRTLRGEMLSLLTKKYPDETARSVFVGFSRPNRRSAIHHHEDIGWLIMRADAIEFLGETKKYSIPRSDITAIRLAWNINTIFGLGRWVSIEGRLGGKAIKMLVEPRERRTMLGNFRFAKTLMTTLRSWKSK